MKIVTTQKKSAPAYVPHLLIQDVSLASGKEWRPPGTGWTVAQISRGAGYWLQGPARAELETGMALLTAGLSGGCVLASCLNGATLRYFTVMPERLSGLMTQGEQDFLKQAADRNDAATRLMPVGHPVAATMMQLAERPNSALLSRLNLLQLLVEAFGGDLESITDTPAPTNVTDRLRAFLRETPPAALLEITFEELARVLGCTPRHLSRVFFEVAGMSFRDKRAEIRLARACELLANSQSKIVDVALDSGYNSLSLFNLMFLRRFGVSPGRWRQKNGGVKLPGGSRQLEPRLMASAGRGRDF
jgi:AraC-like DNA-binding protein